MIMWNQFPHIQYYKPDQTNPGADRFQYCSVAAMTGRNFSYHGQGRTLKAIRSKTHTKFLMTFSSYSKLTFHQTSSRVRSFRHVRWGMFVDCWEAVEVHVVSVIYLRYIPLYSPGVGGPTVIRWSEQCQWTHLYTSTLRSSSPRVCQLVQRPVQGTERGCGGGRE